MSKKAPLEEAEKSAQRIGRVIDGQMPTGWGFLLVLTEYGKNGSLTWVTSAHRSAIPQLCRELAYKMEGGIDSLDTKANIDSDIDKAMELLSLLGTVLSSGVFQLHAVGDPGMVEAFGGPDGFRKAAKDMQTALRSALKQAGDLVRRLKPELLDESDNVEFMKELFGDG